MTISYKNFALAHSQPLQSLLFTQSFPFRTSKIFPTLLTSLFVFGKVDSTIAAASEFLFEIVIVFDVGLARIDEPLALDGDRSSRLSIYHNFYSLSFY